MSRGAARDFQSPGLANSAKEAYQSQLNKATGGHYRRAKALTIQLYMKYSKHNQRTSSPQSHSQDIDPLYKGLSDDEAKELTAYLNQFEAT